MSASVSKVKRRGEESSVRQRRAGKDMEGRTRESTSKKGGNGHQHSCSTLFALGPFQHYMGKLAYRGMTFVACFKYAR